MSKTFYAKEIEVISISDTNYNYWIDNFSTDFVITGNRDFTGHCENTHFEKIVAVLEKCDVEGEIEIFDTDKEDSAYISHADIYSDFFKAKIDDEKARALDEAINKYYNRNTENDGLCEVLTIITEHKWEHNIIRGVSQSDWNYIYYNADVLDDDDIEKICIDYFALGNGWMVSENENFEDAFYMYTYGWNDDGIKAEIANAVGYEDVEIFLSKIEGYSRVANYSEWYQKSDFAAKTNFENRKGNTKMKYKTTMRDVKANYNTIIKVGYCNLQNLLGYFDASAYTCGVYGWNADIYHIDANTCIVTGYRAFGDSVDYDIVERYNNEADKIREACGYNWQAEKDMATNMLNDFVTEYKAYFEK